MYPSSNKTPEKVVTVEELLKKIKTSHIKFHFRFCFVLNIVIYNICNEYFALNLNLGKNLVSRANVKIVK